MKTTDLGNDWFANENDDGTLTIRNFEKGRRIDLPEDSVRTLKRIIVQAAMAIVDKTLVEAYADPMSEDEKAARALGWRTAEEMHGKGGGDGVVHAAGRWASNFTDALTVDVAPGWQARAATSRDAIPF